MAAAPLIPQQHPVALSTGRHSSLVEASSVLAVAVGLLCASVVGMAGGLLLVPAHYIRARQARGIGYTVSLGVGALGGAGLLVLMIATGLVGGSRVGPAGAGAVGLEGKGLEGKELEGKGLEGKGLEGKGLEGKGLEAASTKDVASGPMGEGSTNAGVSI